MSLTVLYYIPCHWLLSIIFLAPTFQYFIPSHRLLIIIFLASCRWLLSILFIVTDLSFPLTAKYYIPCHWSLIVTDYWVLKSLSLTAHCHWLLSIIFLVTDCWILLYSFSLTAQYYIPCFWLLSILFLVSNCSVLCSLFLTAQYSIPCHWLLSKIFLVTVCSVLFYFATHYSELYFLLLASQFYISWSFVSNIFLVPTFQYFIPSHLLLIIIFLASCHWLRCTIFLSTDCSVLYLLVIIEQICSGLLLICCNLLLVFCFNHSIFHSIFLR